MSDVREAFTTAFLNTLPEYMRPAEVSRAMDIALANSHHNGWKPEYLASRIVREAGRADNPVGLMIHLLQKYSKMKAPVTPTPPVVEPRVVVQDLPEEGRKRRQQIFRDLLAGTITSSEAQELIRELYTEFENGGT